MKRNLFLVLGLMVIITSLVLAGGGGDKSSSSRTEITFVFPGTSDPERAYTNGLGDAFNKTYPQYHVNVQFDSWNTILPKLIAMCQANNPPELFWGSQAMFGDLLSMGYLQPMDLGNFDTSQFYPFALEQMTVNGQLYSLPTMIEVALLGGHYNPQIFKRYGVDAAQVVTFNDFLKAAAAVHGQDFLGRGRNDTYGLFFPGTGYDTIYLLEMVLGNNDSSLMEFTSPAKRKQAIEALTFIQQMGRYNVPGYENMDYKDGQRLYVSNNAALVPTVGSWEYGNIYDMVESNARLSEEQVGLMVAPIGPSNRGPAKAFVQAYGPYIFKGISEARKQASSEFIKFHANKENNPRFPAIMHTPSRKDVSLDDILALSPYPDKPSYRQYIQNFQKILASGNTMPRARIPAMNEAGDALRNNCIDMWQGRKTPEQAYEALLPLLSTLWR